MNKIENFRKQVESGFKKGRFSLKSLIALGLFGAIIMVFVFFGLHVGPSGSGSSGSAGRVNNTLISMADLRSESQRLEQMYAPMFGGANLGAAQRQFIQQQALETLIAQELAAQTAKKEGILATDSEIQEVIIKDIPVFQKEGRFQRDLYYQILEANHLNPADFEQKLRNEKQSLRARRLFEVAAQPLQMEVEKLKALRELKINVAFARLDKDAVLKSIKISDADIKAKLVNADFVKKVEEYFAANKPEFHIEPQVHAQHILIKIDAKTTDENAKIQVLEIQKRAQKEDFGKLASQVSQDAGTKVKNGDLGFFGKGKMVPEFEKAAFEQKIGVVGEPIKTPYGYHLLKVLEKKEEREKSLDEVRSEISQKLIASEIYEAEMKILDEALAKSDSAAVDAEIKKLGVAWDETGFFDLAADSVPKLQSPEASKAAFEVSESKPLFPKLVRDGGEKFVIKFKASKKEATADVQRLGQSLAEERSSDLFASWIETAKKTAHIDRNLEAVKER